MPRTTGEIAPEGGVQSVVLALRVLETLARAERSHAGRFQKGLDSMERPPGRAPGASE